MRQSEYETVCMHPMFTRERSSNLHSCSVNSMTFFCLKPFLFSPAAMLQVVVLLKCKPLSFSLRSSFYRFLCNFLCALFLYRSQPGKLSLLYLLYVYFYFSHICHILQRTCACNRHSQCTKRHMILFYL